MHKTFDFNDLFNNININGIHKVINILFNENKNHPNLNDTVNENYFSTLAKFILQHNDILFNNIIYQQNIGLLQRRKTSSMSADLYVYYYESNFFL